MTTGNSIRSRHRRVVLIGLGNPSRRDDGIGPSLLTATVVYRDRSGRNVQSIEVTLRGTPEEAMTVLSALADLPTSEPLMIIDWHRRRMARLGNRAEIEGFARAAG